MYLFSAGVAGCCAKTTIAPLDRIKILLQAQNPHYKHLGTSSRHKMAHVFRYVFRRIGATVFLFAGVFATFKAVLQKEGFLGLYKGNGAMMVRIFPYGAIQFMAFDNYKKVPAFTKAPICSILLVALVLRLCVIYHEAGRYGCIYYCFYYIYYLVETLTFVSSLVIRLVISFSFF